MRPATLANHGHIRRPETLAMALREHTFMRWRAVADNLSITLRLTPARIDTAQQEVARPLVTQ